MNEKIEWGEMNRWELDQRSEMVDTAILPIGSLEQHGPHLPLDTDSFDAGYIVEKAVGRLDPPKPPILPTIPYGVSDHHMSFPGTVTLRSDTLEDIIVDVGRSVLQHGFFKLYIYNGHGGNEAAIRTAAQKLKKETGMLVVTDSFESLSPEAEELVETDNDVHAGEFETSLVLAVRGDMLDERTIPEKEFEFPDPKMEFDHKPEFNYTWNTHDITKTGVIGDATKASKEKGEKLWEAGIERLKKRLETVIDISHRFE
ncbi:MAG: creatininase family protein [Candidatus Thermoplasmatota archaeon]|nr:creatininase family protein [Candidatus Thermoplasmatota archaeon]MBS3789903.1 creatininase family protein [Candidatus Thermoplasmatota archaeon]